MNPAIIILNYNMPEVVDEWIQYLLETVKIQRSLMVVDNGSDPQYACTIPGALRLSRNLRTTGGAVMGLLEAQKYDVTHVWIVSTSTHPPERPWNFDPLARLLENMREDVVGIIPTFAGDSNSWPHQLILTDGSNNVRPHWLVGLFALWDLNWLLAHIDIRLSWSWGIDMDLSHQARLEGKALLKHNGVRIKLNENAGYKLQRMNMSSGERQVQARMEMERVLHEKYGEKWREIMVPFQEYRNLM